MSDDTKTLYSFTSIVTGMQARLKAAEDRERALEGALLQVMTCSAHPLCQRCLDSVNKALEAVPIQMTTEEALKRLNEMLP